MPYDLTEGDILIIFSQYGIPVHMKLVRDKETGNSKGFGWLKYEDQRSTILAVDNLNGTKILNRIIRVDHAFYEDKDYDEEYENLLNEELKNDFVKEEELNTKDRKESEIKDNDDNDDNDEFKDPLLLMQKLNDFEEDKKKSREHRHREHRSRRHRSRDERSEGNTITGTERSRSKNRVPSHQSDKDRIHREKNRSRDNDSKRSKDTARK
ncbi:hypothetical protein WICMUC_004949 [Wickerhamomyces mucosus]|uniref:RRM domain-containing protein n=1 Tax=Wickerhamomyces mucosus TaxID=1378264 RepID=A0A9P8PCM1_9ASCO|nr:hypothetical protein WICMUC_004949 [Wickerhamomyces mucosus]